MTQYATPIDLRNATSALELAQVATPAGSAPPSAADMSAGIDTGGLHVSDPVAAAYGNILDALTRASGLMDTRLARCYTLPLQTPYPEILVVYCCDIARFALSRDRATDEMRYRFERAIKDLDQAAAGLLNLGAVSSVAGQNGPAGAGIAFVQGGTRDNTYATLCQYQNGPFASC